MISRHYDVVVLGGGISGMVAASILSGRGKAVLLLDGYERLGGNHIDVAIGPYTFDIGSFFFSDDSPFFEHFPDLRPLYHPGDYTMGRITPHAGIATYPISWRQDIIARGPLEWARMAASLAHSRARIDPDRDALAYAEYWLGRRFAHQSGLVAYLGRFYGVDPRLIETEFARKRMGWIANDARLRRVLERLLRPPGPPANRQLVRPRSGFGVLYAAARRSLEEGGAEIRLKTEVDAICGAGDGFEIKTADGSVATAEVVGTIPLGRMLQLCGLEEVPLRSRELTSLFYSFEGRRGFPVNVLYNFSHEAAWKRLTMHSDFYGPADGRMFFTVEVLSDDAPGDIGAVHVAFARHMREQGLFDGDLRLEGSRVTGNAYPIYVAGASATAAAGIARLRDFGITAFGRQGGFDYQPSGVISTRVARAALGGR